MKRELYHSQKKSGIKAAVERKVFQILRKRSERLLAMRGQRMAVFANDYVGNMINVQGFYEIDELDILRQYLLPIAAELKSGVALDVGANIGNHTVYFADMFSEIHAFEPNPLTYKLLDFNLSFQQNAYPHSYGLGDKAGSFELFECPTNLGKSSIKYRADGEIFRVDVKAIDGTDFADKNIVFIKIDVEGLEENVLIGARETISRACPLIVFEQHVDDFKDGTSPSIRFLTALGYRFCWLEGRPDSDEKFAKFIYDARAMFLGTRNALVTGQQVPAKFHNMILAVPPRFQEALGV